MMKKLKIAQGQTPTIQQTLIQSNGQPVNLTGCTVTFVFQIAGGGVNFSGAATLVNATMGQVSYTFGSGQTATAGSYEGQWQVVDGSGNTTLYPSGGTYFCFDIQPALPTTPPTGFATLAQLYDDVRAVTGDFNRQLYTNEQLASVMRVQLRLGKIIEPPCRGQAMIRFALGADNQTISPTIGNSNVHAYALLVYRTAHALVLPNIAAYNYRTRAMSERFGEQKDFLFTLQNILYELENGEQTWAEISGLRSWLFMVNGIWIWSFTELEQSFETSFH